MTENSRAAAAIKGQLAKFSGVIARDLSKPKRRLAKEIIYGIQAAKVIKLSHITRALNELIHSPRRRTGCRAIWMTAILQKRLITRSAVWAARRSWMIWSSPLTREISGKSTPPRWNTSARSTTAANRTRRGLLAL